MSFCNIATVLYLMIKFWKNVVFFLSQVFASVYCFPDSVCYVLFDKNISLTTEVMGVTMWTKRAFVKRWQLQVLNGESHLAGLPDSLLTLSCRSSNSCFILVVAVVISWSLVSVSQEFIDLLIICELLSASCVKCPLWL